MRYWIRVKLLKTGKLCYSIIRETSLRETLQPCKFIEWNRIKKNNCGSLLCFQPQYHHHFLLPLGGSKAEVPRQEQQACYCSAPWREKEKLLSEKHLSPAGPRVLHKGGNHCPFADEDAKSRGWSGLLTQQGKNLGCLSSCSRGQEPPRPHRQLQERKAPSDLTPFPGCWSLAPPAW